MITAIFLILIFILVFTFYLVNKREKEKELNNNEEKEGWRKIKIFDRFEDLIGYGYELSLKLDNYETPLIARYIDGYLHFIIPDWAILVNLHRLGSYRNDIIFTKDDSGKEIGLDSEIVDYRRADIVKEIKVTSKIKLNRKFLIKIEDYLNDINDHVVVYIPEPENLKIDNN